MIKALKTLTVFILLALISLYFILPNLILKKITDYEPYTFEYILNNPDLVAEYGIPGKSSPADYNYKSEVVKYTSLDGTRLEGWYINAKKPSKHSIVFVHGRTSNRLKTMKYLALVDSLQLDTIYNVFIPDLRNSGKSEAASTYMGYKFGEDLAVSIQYLSDNYDQDNFLLYGFSMGAMAICNALYRPQLKRLFQNNVRIEKIIFDSPLVNVKETLRLQTGTFPTSEYFFDRVFDLYSLDIDGFGENMKLSSLLDTSIPTLILQSKDDATTQYATLENELKQIPMTGNLHIVLFEGPGHVKIFQDHRTRSKYIQEVRNFLLL